MQHEKRNSFFRKLRDRGYYIVLGLCIAAVGVSGYLFTRSVRSSEAEPIPTEALRVTVPAVTAPDHPLKKLDELPDTLQEVIGTAAPEETTPHEPLRGQISPVEGAAAQSYSMDSLAYNPTTRDWRTHDGTDLLAGIGTQVLAAADGTVEAVYLDDSLGQTVTVRHEDGFVTQYANLEEAVSVSVGQSVHAGDVLGTVGSTAPLEIGAEPHLHFAVYHDGISIDPAEFLP